MRIPEPAFLDRMSDRTLEWLMLACFWFGGFGFGFLVATAVWT